MNHSLTKLRFDWIIVIGIAIYLVWAALFLFNSSEIAIDGQRWFCLFDDAMISLRYAWNFAHGLGLVWNPGERVEGYTNPLMTLIMAVPAIFLDKRFTVFAIQIFGIVTALLTAWLASILAYEGFTEFTQTERKRISQLSLFATLGYYPVSFWSIMGMETGILTVCLYSALLFALRYQSSAKRRDLFFLTGTLSLAYFVRPDAVLFAGIVAGYLVMQFWRNEKKIDGIGWITAGASFTGIIALHLVWRLHYYGELVPNTYVLKVSGMPFAQRLYNGINFQAPFLFFLFPSFLLAMWGLFTLRSGVKWLLIGCFAAAVGYVCFIGGEPFPYWRMATPAVPLLLTLFCAGWYKLAMQFVGRQSGGELLKTSFGKNIILFVGVVAALFFANYRFGYEILLWKPYNAINVKHVINQSIAVIETTKPDASIGVVAAGALPYFTGRYAIDYLGKCDRWIAQLAPDLKHPYWHRVTSVPGHNKYDLSYSLQTLQPDVSQYFMWQTQNYNEWALERYVAFEYRGTRIWVRKGSPNVIWERGKIVDNEPLPVP